MGPTWVLSDPDGPHVGPTNLAIRVMLLIDTSHGIDNVWHIGYFLPRGRHTTTSAKSSLRDHIKLLIQFYLSWYQFSATRLEDQLIMYSLPLHYYAALARGFSWWHNQMETLSALLAICAGNSPVYGEFPTQRPVTRSFDVFIDLRLNKRLSKQSRGWWFETLSRPYDVTVMSREPVSGWSLGSVISSIICT